MADDPHPLSDAELAAAEALDLPQIQLAHIDSFTPYAMNAREHPPEQLAEIAASIREFGWTFAILRRGDTVIGVGHGRLGAARLIYAAGGTIRMFNGFELPPGMLPFYDCSAWSEARFKAYVLADNRLAEKATWNKPMLSAALEELRGLEFDLPSIGFDLPDLAAIFGEGEANKRHPANAGALAARFGIPPFSVLNAREGWWQERKAAWLSLGIKSEVGRGENLLKMSDTMLEPDPEKRAAMQEARERRTVPAGLAFGKVTPHPGAGGAPSGTSIFDPVLCELAYRWFCPRGGLVLDPFAGGSVRGVVASRVGRRYVGFELRPEQVEANRAQADEIIHAEAMRPQWIEGDSRLTISAQDDLAADFVFTCPPYGDLEVYSNDAADLSTMAHEEFLAAYRAIIAAAIARLRSDRFACVVVGDFRDGDGLYRNFVSDTIAAFEAAGARLYNEAILVTAVGTLAIRAGKQFAHSRKFGKAHQNVLVFVKGDPVAAAAAIGACEFGEVDGVENAAPASEAEASASPPSQEEGAAREAPLPFAEASAAD